MTVDTQLSHEIVYKASLNILERDW